MGKTIVEKILGNHAGRDVKPGDIVDVTIDARVARDFGGANVVKNIRNNSLGVADPQRTFFTFDCNPGGSDQRYAENQQFCRLFARETGIEICDINAGIGTHLAMDRGLVGPGETFVSTDSHANIMGAIGAFGQGMGDQDIAHAFAFGTVWFKVPPTVKVRVEGQPAANATPKDVTLALCKHFGANGLLGFPPNQVVLEFCEQASGRKVEPVYADPDAEYADDITVSIDGIGPMVARPGHPDDAVPTSEMAGTKVDSVFIGSCTNGRYEDLVAGARVLEGRKVAPGVVLKVVPATDAVWQRLLNEGVIKTFKEAGALFGNAGCAGCAAGQIGQNGPGEVTVSTGNRNFPGKQGKGSVYLASPETAAASAVAGVIATADAIPAKPAEFKAPKPAAKAAAAPAKAAAGERPTKIKGRVWRIAQDNIDTDMIYHNRYLTITDPAEMGQYTFDNLEGWKDFAKKAKPGDIVITGKNFGCGSSRQQAVDCFKTLGVAAIVAESFGAIYERNAINAGFAIMNADTSGSDIADGEELEIDFRTGKTRRVVSGEEIAGTPVSEAQLAIYQRGGLFAAGGN